MTDIIENTQTEFNVALASLQRLHELLKECNEYSRFCRVPAISPNYLFLWRDTLKAVYREISPKLDKKEKKSISDIYNRSRFSKIFSYKTTEEGNIKSVNIKVFVFHCNLMDKLEIRLRELADKRGMLIPNKPSSKRAIAETE